MPGTRTAPTVAIANSLFTSVSVRFMDWTGDIRTDTYKLLPTATDAQIEALVAALQAASNATLYEVKVSAVYASVADSNNALEEVWENVSDNLVIQAKEPTGNSLRIFVPSPVNGMFVENTDDIDPTSGILAAILAAWSAAIDPTFDIVGARFTSRRQINQQIKI